jgi:hypothetical protein
MAVVVRQGGIVRMTSSLQSRDIGYPGRVFSFSNWEIIIMSSLRRPSNEIRSVLARAKEQRRQVIWHRWYVSMVRGKFENLFDGAWVKSMLEGRSKICPTRSNGPMTSPWTYPSSYTLRRSEDTSIRLFDYFSEYLMWQVFSCWPIIKI